MLTPTPLSASKSKQTTLTGLKFVKISKRDLEEEINPEMEMADSSNNSISSKKVKLESPSTATEDSEPITSTSKFKVEDNEDLKERKQDDLPFKALQVTNPSFIETYKVSGIPDVYYMENWIDSKTSRKWLKELEGLKEWYRPILKVYGKTIQQSRQIAAFSTTSSLKLKYSGQETQMHSPFPLILKEIAEKLSSDDCLGKEVRFNHVMLNMYDDGSIYIGKHSDNLENLVIVTISLGAERSWIMERKPPRKGSKAALEIKGQSLEKKRWKLGNGSLLVMQGDSQKDWKHEIPKELKVKDKRISLTFRQLVY